MSYFNRSFSSSNTRSNSRPNSRSRNTKSNYSRFNKRARNGGGRRQASFDPSHVVLQASMSRPELTKQEEYIAINKFTDFNISDELKKNIAARGYTTPTPIQDQAIPHIIDKKDVVGIANTGTGKTAAFLIPLLDRIAEGSGEQVLIIVPTRELALQVRDELRAFSGRMRIFSTLCIGGSSIHRQIESLRRGQDFVIGTPGRIKDLNQRRKIRFEEFSNIVLDEVDRMLDMGFVHEIKAIIDRLPKERQSLFFSATMTDRVREIMKGFLTNPVSISVKTKETTDNIKQEVLRIKGRSKLDMLHDLLISDGFEKVLVFGRTKHGMERLSKDLQNRGFKVNAIHGNKSQGQRQRALREFKSNQLQALVATDVVARGVDIDNVTHVINFDLPESYADYIHRIGRTGRADKIGTAITFVG